VSQCHQIPFYSIFECLLIQKARGKRLNKHFGGFSQVDIGQTGNNMLTTRVDDVKEAHNSAVNCIKVNVTSLKECRKLVQECAVVRCIIEGPVAPLPTCISSLSLDGHRIVYIPEPLCQHGPEEQEQQKLLPSHHGCHRGGERQAVLT